MLRVKRMSIGTILTGEDEMLRVEVTSMGRILIGEGSDESTAHEHGNYTDKR